jgi:predicted DNA-binding transcriptional regulator
MNDRLMGALVLLASLAGVVVYFYLVFLAPWALLVIQVSAFLAVAAVLVIVAWIGYTLATTPPPGPIDASWEESEEEDSEV